MKKVLFSVFLFLCFVSGVSSEPIRLHPENGHYFLFRGEPTVLITSGEHYGAVLNLDFDYETYLKTLFADKLNYTRIFTGVYVESSESFGIEKNPLAPEKERVITPWARSNVPGYANGGNKFDLDRWNGDYFNRLKAFISLAGEYGIVVEVTLFTSIYNSGHWKLSPFHPANNINSTDDIPFTSAHTPGNGNIMTHQKSMVRKIVRELNGFDNVIFEIQNEPWPDQRVTADVINPFDLTSRESWVKRIDIPTAASFEWHKIIAALIAEEEKALPQKHIIAQNYCNFYYPIKDVVPGISIINFHYAWPEAVLLNYGWNKVIGFDESGFAGSEDKTYRKQAWKFILSGGGLFNNLDYSFVTGYENGTYKHAESPGGGSPELRKQLRVLKDYIHSFNFTRMHPDRSVVKKAPGVYTYTLAETGRQYALFVNGGSSCDMDLLFSPGEYSVEWINTKNGTVEKIEQVTAGGGTVTVSSPAYEDGIAVRILKK